MVVEAGERYGGIQKSPLASRCHSIRLKCEDEVVADAKHKLEAFVVEIEIRKQALVLNKVESGLETSRC